MQEVKLYAEMRVIAGELETFHYQSGGFRLLPHLERVVSESHIMRFMLKDGESQASILIRPDGHNLCTIIVNENDSELWAWRLGVPGRSELGETTHLGVETSPRCVDFCDRFIQHLEVSGYTESVKPETKPLRLQVGGSPYEEDIWAKEQVHELGKNPREVFDEWLEMSLQAGRFSGESRTEKDLYDLFSKAIR